MRTIGRYQVLGKLATGGMAEILLARLVGPLGFEKAVAIKRILPHLAASSQFAEMFLSEARIAAELRHPNVVSIHELGSEAGELFMVMEYLEGESVSGILRRLWSERRSMNPAAALLLAAGACAGLHAAHELTDAQGRLLRLVHRDVSPSNLFVTYEGQVKVLDFGVAKVEGGAARTEAGMVKGKGPYMSPEQALARPLDRRSDLFSLGIVLFEMCTMRRLFLRENALLVYRAICEEPIPTPREADPRVIADVDRIVQKVLARDPADRYATALEMRRELLAAARQLTSEEPEELLAAMMRELFAARIAEKSEFVSRIEQSGEVLRVPEAETDLGASIPSVQKGSGAGSSRARKRRFLPGWVAAAGAAVAIVPAVLATSRPDANSVVSGSSPERPAPPPLATSGVTKLGTASRVVTIEIQSQPPGARIALRGTPSGMTPARLELVASDEAIPVELALPGFQRHRLEMRPDIDQRLVVTLEAEPPAPSAATALQRVNAPRALASAGARTSGPPPAFSASAPALGEFRRFDSMNDDLIRRDAVEVRP